MDDKSYVMLEIWGRHETEKVEGGTRHMWYSEYYTFCDSSEGSSLRDEQHTRELVDSLIGKSSAWKNYKPEKIDGEFVPWFRICVIVSDTRKKVSKYAIDYEKCDSCPLEVISSGMDIYRSIKRTVKKAIKAKRAKA